MAFRVLVVDDATFIRETIKRALRQLISGVEILEAVDGRKAMSVLKNNQVDLIMSDWEMPEVSGEEFLRWVRSQPKTMDIPFLMVTSRGDRDHVITAVNAGVSDYLTKPFTPEEFVRKVGKQLRLIGYVAPERRGGAAPKSDAFSSLDVLTGGSKQAAAKVAAKPAVQAASGFGKPVAKKAVAKGASTSTASAGNFTGKAQIRLARGACVCVIRELSLQALSGLVPRGELVPTVFEQAAVDLFNAKGEALAQVNGYVHAVVATEPKPSSASIKVTIRFVDNDPDKFEALSKAIAAGS
ncbi:MAG: CheY-like chemotaxis protein [Flavobacteriales bacterium]|jgi:CheY-like chemotaxis protein